MIESQISNSLIMKIGGSLIMNEQGVILDEIIKQLGYELKVLNYKGLKCIIVFGGGYIVKQIVKPLKHTTNYIKASLSTVDEISNCFDKQGRQIKRSLSNINLHYLYIEPKDVFNYKNHALTFDVQTFLFKLTRHSCLITHTYPFSCGNNVYFLPSGDEIVRLLAQNLNPNIVVFLTNVDGVYLAYPPKEDCKPLKTVDNNILKNLRKSSEMYGKVSSALKTACYATKVYIINGNKTRLINEILTNGFPSIGTKVQSMKYGEN